MDYTIENSVGNEVYSCYDIIVHNSTHMDYR